MYKNKRFEIGDINVHMKDYSNLDNRVEIDGKEFQEMIESNFPEYRVESEYIKGWNTDKKHLLCKEVYLKRPESKKDLRVMMDKSFIVIKEATDREDGIVIGIHDKDNFKAIIKKIEKDV